MSKHRKKQKRTTRIKFAKAQAVTTVTPPSPALVGTMRGVPFIYQSGAFSFASSL